MAELVELVDVMHALRSSCVMRPPEYVVISRIARCPIPSRLDFEILGPLRVGVDGGEVVVGSVRQRTLLAALLVARGSVLSADRLAEILWGRHQPQAPGQALQTHVSRLRGLLDPAAGAGVRGVLATRAPGYALLVDADQVDAGLSPHLHPAVTQRSCAPSAPTRRLSSRTHPRSVC